MNCVPEHKIIFSLAEILVIAGGAIPPARAVPVSTRNSATLKRVVNTLVVHPFILDWTYVEL